MRRLALTLAIVGVLVLAGGTALARDRGHHPRGAAHTARRHAYLNPHHYRGHPYHPRSHYSTRVVVPYVVRQPVVVPYGGPSIVYPSGYYSYPYYSGPRTVFSYGGRGFGISIGF